MTEPTPEWVEETPGAPVHASLSKVGGPWTRPFTPGQLIEIGGQLIEQFLRKVTEALVGFFIPGAGPAFDQLFDWAHNLATAAYGAFNDIGELISNIGGAVIGDVADAINGAVSGLTNLLDDLLHNASAVIGNIPKSLVSGLNDALDAATEFVQNVIDAIISGIRRVPFVGGSIANLIEDLTGFSDDQQATKDAVVAGITGNEVSGTTAEDLADAVSEQSQAIADLAAQQAALEQVVSGQENGGNQATERFEYVDADSLDPGLWDDNNFLQGSSSIAVLAVEDGHNAGQKVLSSSGIAIQMAVYIGPCGDDETGHTAGDFQKVSATIAQSMSKPGAIFGFPTDTRSSDLELYVRVSDDKTQWVRYRWSRQGEIRLEYQNGASSGQIGSTKTGQGRPPVGSTVSMAAGVGASSNAFQLRSGNQIIQTISDTDHLTAVGESNRRGGFGMKIDDGVTGGKITQWQIEDNAPQAVTGTTARSYRVSTSGESVNADGNAHAIATLYDTADYATPDIFPTTAGMNILKSGTYAVEFSMEFNFTGAIDGQVSARVYRDRDGDIPPVSGVFRNHVIGGVQSGSTGLNLEWDRYVSGSTLVYCQAGDILTAQLFTTTSGVEAVGRASGSSTFISIAKVG